MFFFDFRAYALSTEERRINEMHHMSQDILDDAAEANYFIAPAIATINRNIIQRKSLITPLEAPTYNQIKYFFKDQINQIKFFFQKEKINIYN